METLAYLYAAQEYEYPEEKEIDLNWVNRAAVMLLGVTCSTGVVSSAAQAVTVFRGDDGADVTRLQNLLRDAGYFPIASTGFFGEVTEESVRAFQKAKGLAVDGVAGDNTFKALEPSTRPPIAPVTPATPNPATPATPVAPTTPGVVSTTDLGFGDSGTSVVRLQEMLRRAGYFSGLSTGFFGATTRDSVTRFQQANRIPADGFAGRATQIALENAPAAGIVTTPVSNVRPTTPTTTPAVTPTRPAIAISRSLGYGDEGEDVKALQKRLTELKYFSGPVSGFYGELTEAAVMSLQKAKNLQVDGILGAKSLAALR
jgi:peptidoglycan hydrolase-like protein with peptidoglycan-binding domain